MTAELVLKNAGINPLMVHRIYSNDSHVSCTLPKAIKSGKSDKIRIEIDATKATPAQYNREITIITNDPKKSTIKVQLVWTVE